MFDTTTYISGALVGTREGIGHVQLINIMQALLRAQFTPESTVHHAPYRFITYRTSDGWSADLMVSVSK